MRNIFRMVLISMLAGLSACPALWAQSPDRMSYQAVVRNSEGVLLSNQSVGIRIQILQASEFGAAVYVETHTRTTNPNGLVTLEIGGGTVVLGNFSLIDWAAGPYFLKTETDPAGGTSYSILGTTQLLSVPYALHARTVGSYTETDPVYSISAASGISTTDINNWKAAFNWGDHSLAGYVSSKLSLTINGKPKDLTEDRSWDVGTVTSVGLSMPSLFSVSGSPVTGSGNLSATLVNQSANRIFASPDGATGPPSFRGLTTNDIPNLDWSKITTGKPTTLTGYGIINGVNTDAAQAISGSKYFLSEVTVQPPEFNSNPATKEYVDEIIRNMFLSTTLQVRDYEGNLYNTIRIGDQVWMAENLKTKHLNDGTALGYVTDPAVWSTITVRAYCFYDNNSGNESTYGLLYNWHAVNTGKLCPVGWHVATDTEWTYLSNALQGATIAGGKMKEAGTVHWADPNTGATNSSKFTGLPGGWRNASGYFSNLRYTGWFWTSTEATDNTAYHRALQYNSVEISRTHIDKKSGSSVRCILN